MASRLPASPLRSSTLRSALALGLLAGCGLAERDPSQASTTPEAVAADAIDITPTNYPVPAGAIFVSAASGNDANAGTEAAPLRTVAAAVRKATAGSTIVLRAGEYREALGGIFKRITLQPYPGEKAWFKGSDVVDSTRFVADANTFRLDAWNPAICHTGCAGGDADLYEGSITRAEDTEMVFLDGAPQTAVASKAAVVPGTFFNDFANQKLYLGSNPSGHRVEIAVREHALQFDTTYSAGAIVRGLGFVHYANRIDYSYHPGAIIANTDNVTFENNTVADNAGAGTLLQGRGIRVRGNLFVRNGFNGVNGNRCDDLVIEANRVTGNNVRHIAQSNSRSFAAAGIHGARLKNIVVRDNVITGNSGSGFWCDLSCYRNTIVRNVVSNNTEHGIFYEISAEGVIASNVVTRSGLYGIKVSGSNHVRVYNNTVVDNRQAIWIAEDDRPYWNNCNNVNCPSTDEQALGITWDTADVTLRNNLFIGGASSTRALFDTIDVNTVASGKRVGADGMIPVAQMNYNGYYRAAAATPATLIQWTLVNGSNTLYTNLASFQSATGRERNGRYQEGSASFLRNATGGDYRLAVGSPALGAGTALPTDIAAAIGVPASPVDLGALNWPGRDAPTAPPSTDAGTGTDAGTDASAATDASADSGTAPAPSNMTAPLYGIHRTGADQVLTLNLAEAQAAVANYGYVSDGTKCHAASSATTGLVPVYRLYQASTYDRLFTTNAAERDSAIANYRYASEGIGFYAATQAATGRVPVYRLVKGSYHQYAVGDAERSAAIAAGWALEHTAFYVAP